MAKKHVDNCGKETARGYEEVDTVENEFNEDHDELCSIVAEWNKSGNRSKKDSSISYYQHIPKKLIKRSS